MRVAIHMSLINGRRLDVVGVELGEPNSNRPISATDMRIPLRSIVDEARDYWFRSKWGGPDQREYVTDLEAFDRLMPGQTYTYVTEYVREESDG